MEVFYPITMNGNPVGKMSVERKGLYYRFCGRCSLNRDGIYRAAVTCGTHQERLGVLIPEGDSFCVRTSLPVKRIGEGELSFQVLSDHATPTGVFVPIIPEEPFAYIARLKDSFLETQGNQTGIRIEKEQE